MFISERLHSQKWQTSFLDTAVAVNCTEYTGHRMTQVHIAFTFTIYTYSQLECLLPDK